MSEPTRCRPLAICIGFLSRLSESGLEPYPDGVNTVNPWQAMRRRALVSRGEGCQLDEARPAVRAPGRMPLSGKPLLPLLLLLPPPVTGRLRPPPVTERRPPT